MSYAFPGFDFVFRSRSPVPEREGGQGEGFDCIRIRSGETRRISLTFRLKLYIISFEKGSEILASAKDKNSELSAEVNMEWKKRTKEAS